MPRYYFNVEDGASIPDRSGTELPNLRAARMEAVRLSGRLLHQEPDTFWDIGDDWRMIVTDREGIILFSLHFAAFGAPDTPQIYHSLEDLPALPKLAISDARSFRGDQGGAPNCDEAPEPALSRSQMAAAVSYQRTNRSMGLDAVAEGVGLLRTDLVSACRQNKRFARELNFREARDGDRS